MVVYFFKPIINKTLGACIMKNIKKMLLVVFVSLFAVNCGANKEGSVLTPRPEKFDSFHVTLSGGKDFYYESSAKVEIVSYKSNEEENKSYDFSSKYGDAIKSMYLGYKVCVGDKVLVSVFPSEAHKVVSVDLNGEQYTLEGNNVSITIKEAENIFFYGNYLNIKFEIKDEYLEEPVIVGDEYQISTSKQLRWIAARGQRGEKFEGKTIKLMNDIDMENIEFTGIASGSILNSFFGTFDGNGHEVKNINIKQHPINTGFIGKISETGSVINLNLSGSVVSTSEYTGAVAGDNSGLIKNVVSKVSVKGNNYVAGIVGYNTGYIENCINDGNITGEEYVSGIVGLSDGISIKSVTNNGNITGYKNIAQIGYYYPSNTIIEDAIRNGILIENVHVSFDE